MLRLEMDAPGGTLTIEGEDVKKLVTEAAFFQALPTVCPIDGTPTRFDHRSPQGYDYYSVVSTGPTRFECKLGQHQEGGTLFVKGQWTYYDLNTKQDVVVWDYGKPTEEGARIMERLGRNPGSARSQSTAPADPTPRPAGNGAPLPGHIDWMKQVLDSAGVPDNMYGAVLTNVTARPLGDNPAEWTREDGAALHAAIKQHGDDIVAKVLAQAQSAPPDDGLLGGDGDDLPF